MMTENIGNGSAQGVVDFLNSLVDKGRSRAGVVAPLKIALVKILEKTEGENWQRVDVTKLDVDDAVNRFKNLTLGVYTDASYRAYELRAKRAIAWYKQFLANPGWYPKESARAVIAETKKQIASTTDRLTNPETGIKITSNASGADNGNHTPHNEISHQLPKTEPISYPFPLQSGDMARIYMPKSVTKRDIVRLSAFLDALVIEGDNHEESL